MEATISPEKGTHMSNALINAHTKMTQRLQEALEAPERGEIPAYAVIIGAMVALALVVVGIMRTFTMDQLSGLQ